MPINSFVIHLPLASFPDRRKNFSVFIKQNFPFARFSAQKFREGERFASYHMRSSDEIYKSKARVDGLVLRPRNCEK